ncbi:MAG: hypothetical protein H7323_13475 [Frankiales bacterium]|nr:hypothetical protein [Frankiales bacterium]
MASLRSTVRMTRPADAVWKVVPDAAGISAWPDGALVVYSTEISPDSLAEAIGPSIDGGGQSLKARLEASC